MNLIHWMSFWTNLLMTDLTHAGNLIVLIKYHIGINVTFQSLSTISDDTPIVNGGWIK